MDAPPFAVISLVLALLTLCIYRIFAYRQLPLPPGPKPIFFLGNVHQLPRSEPWLTFAQWSHTYGPMVFFRVFRRKVMVLNSLQAAIDLLDNRSSIYSDRPVLYSGRGLDNRKLAVFSISSQHPRFKKYRRLLQSGLNLRATQSYRHVLEDEMQVLLRGLANTPENFVAHIRRNSGALVLKLAFGYTVMETDDPFVTLMEEAFRLQAEFSKPSPFHIDMYPILGHVPSWVPFQTVHRRINEYARRIRRVDRIPHAWAKEQIASGNYLDSFTSRHLRTESGEAVSPEEDDIVKWCASALYVGGADTTAAVVTAFILQMTLHPDMQKRAQAEIAQVIGTSRLPSIDDKDCLPYVSALIQETLRWAPPAPLGLPHRLTEDDVYEGRLVPKGTILLANVWHFAHDPVAYPEPFEYRPERFLPAEGIEPQADPRRFVFGFGRRICPGQHFAETSLFLAISSILATFHISKARDSDGLEIEPHVEFTTTVTSHVKPFACSIVPRAPDLIPQ
ncbi:cytochrome P450 [Amylocystis lapponica]|nr:cytochrome P450 [Amylocystis lapponica]